MGLFAAGGAELSPEQQMYGYHVGFGAEFPLSDKMQMRFSIDRSTRGYEVGYQVPSTGLFQVFYRQTMQLTYLEMPLLVRLFLTEKGVRPYLQGGGYAGFALGGTTDTRIDQGPDASSTESRDVRFGLAQRDDLRRGDAGLVVGAGVRLQHFDLSVNYYAGQRNLYPDNLGAFMLFNRQLSLTLSYIFTTD